MTWLVGIKIYAAASLLFTALYATWGYRWQKRKEIKREYRAHEIEPVQDIIRTGQ